MARIKKRHFQTDIVTDPADRWVIARISTSAADRDGDVLLPQGVKLDAFRRNPVVLWSHEANKRPLGKAVDIRPTSSHIVAKVVWARRPDSLPHGVEWEPDTVHSLFQQGILRAFSIGADVGPNGTRAATNNDRMRFGHDARRIITNWELAEFSVVPVGVNRDALVESISKGWLEDRGIVAELANEAEADQVSGVLDAYEAPVLQLQAPKARLLP